MIKKLYQKIISFLVLLGLLLSIIPIPIQKTFSAHELKLDSPSYWIDTTVSIDGYIYLNLLSPSLFKGQLRISTYPFTTNSDDLYLEINNKTGAPLIYKTDETERIPGKVFFSTFFNDIAIIVFEGYAENKNLPLNASNPKGSWGTKDGYCIVSSSTRDKAIKFLSFNNIIS
ncbi:MAG: hypothetical protein IKU95_03230 [Clostridia bacterium]|nr:hypothetical protein [Clostridia bacterium]